MSEKANSLPMVSIASTYANGGVAISGIGIVSLSAVKSNAFIVKT